MSASQAASTPLLPQLLALAAAAALTLVVFGAVALWTWRELRRPAALDASAALDIPLAREVRAPRGDEPHA